MLISNSRMISHSWNPSLYKIVTTVVLALTTFIYLEADGYMYERSQNGNVEWQVTHKKLAELLPNGHDPSVYTSSNSDMSNWVIVTLRDGLEKKTVDNHIEWLTSSMDKDAKSQKNKGNPAYMGIHCLYQTGYAGRFNDKIISELENKKEVLFVRKDKYVSIDKNEVASLNDISSNNNNMTKILRDDDSTKDNQLKIISRTGLSTNYGPSWGLDRINQHLLPLDGLFSALPPRGAGVDIYVLDAGVMLSHSEFGGRAKYGATFVSGHSEDIFGHGTHVSGIIAGRTVGVANQANIISVKVIYDNGQGPVSSVVMGLDWAVRNAKATRRPSVINMSIGTNKDDTLDHAVLSAVRAGILVVVSAGNDKANACESSPSGLSSSFTIGATDPSDARAPYSNFGNCVKLYAPGSYIRSASNKGNYTYKLLNGTSMAAPFVTGTAALHLSRFPQSPPLQTMREVIRGSTQRLISDPEYRGGMAPMLFIGNAASRFNIQAFSAPYSVGKSMRPSSVESELDDIIEDDYKRITSRPRKAFTPPTTTSYSIYTIIGIITIISVLLY